MIAKIKRKPVFDPKKTESFYLTDCPCCGRHLGWRLYRTQQITCRFCGNSFIAEEIEKTS